MRRIGRPPSIVEWNLTRFNKISTQTTVQMAADKEAVGLLRVRMHDSISRPYEIIVRTQSAVGLIYGPLEK